MLLERASALGGRARTDIQAGHAFNLGAHALYVDGPAFRGLRELGVTFSGRPPPTSGLLGLARGELHRFPAGLLSMIATDLFGVGGKIDAARALATLARTDPATPAGRPLGRVAAARRAEGGGARRGPCARARDHLCKRAAASERGGDDRPGKARDLTGRSLPRRRLANAGRRARGRGDRRGREGAPRRARHVPGGGRLRAGRHRRRRADRGPRRAPRDGPRRSANADRRRQANVDERRRPLDPLRAKLRALSA